MKDRIIGEDYCDKVVLKNLRICRKDIATKRRGRDRKCIDMIALSAQILHFTNRFFTENSRIKSGKQQ